MSSSGGTPSSPTDATTISSRDREVAEQLGFEILSVLGRGAMGVVYRARQIDLDRLVALKTIRSDRLDDANSADRFHREALAVARLQHPAIVQALRYGMVGSVAMLAMEFVDGENCQDLLQRGGPLDAASTWDIIRQTAGGLLHASRHGVLHRDIKPGNLMIVPWPEGVHRRGGIGMVKIADFGLALLDELSSFDDRLTGSGNLIGSPAYMAPERFDQEATSDVRSDIYSLGVTAVVLRMGRHPFGSSSLLKLIAQKSKPLHSGSPSLQHLGEEERGLVAEMLAPQMNDRPTDHETLIERIDNLRWDDSPSLAFDGQAGPNDKTQAMVIETAVDTDDFSIASEELNATMSPAATLDSDASRTSVLPGARRRGVGWFAKLAIAAAFLSAAWMFLGNRDFFAATIERSHTRPGQSQYLFDGKTLSGFSVGGQMVGQWTALPGPDGGNTLACLSERGFLRRPLADDASRPRRWTLMVQSDFASSGDAAGLPDPSVCELQFDLPSSPIGQRYAVRLDQSSVGVVVKSEAFGEPDRTVAERPVGGLGDRPHVIHLERQPEGWFVFFEQQYLARLPLLDRPDQDQPGPDQPGPDQPGRGDIALMVEQRADSPSRPSFLFSDLQATELEPRDNASTTVDRPNADTGSVAKSRPVVASRSVTAER